ncbi:EamA family transporter RarD [Paenibacillus ehimensis]|uniref:EamA family transporter RarD n=1 Tax=Paenibacillus ehimensis TaxID=79264 RepID=A0ABT8V6R1_9BACL|nr:EamA family transporter RarD [Paenibacillus ehimensis]MDO3676428.1 EamA family transporter RarD [Paenibacillus ehimensis]MEC0208447.1 EamA family transporter RarD [Paenibacillus ehimensis]
MNAGIIYGLLAYLAWGLLPLFWKTFISVSSGEILGHRVVWSFVFVALLLLIGGRWKALKSAFSERKNVLPMIGCSLLISLNWLIYIWAVNHDRVVETSLGYYINPLISVLLGVCFLGERLRVVQWAAMALATAGVTVLTFSYGSVPWISLALALSFGVYGLVKKKMHLEPMVSLAGETVVVLPVAAVYLLVVGMTGQSTTSSLSADYQLLLALSGVATAMPLLWFAQAAQRLSLTTVGFLQYLAPTISLILGVALYDEPFTTVHLISFCLIWSALLLFTLSSLKGRLAMRATGTGVQKG